MVRHENELMNHRVLWLRTLQGLLFTALGFAWEKADAYALIYVFCATGAVVAISSQTVLNGAHQAIDQLRQWWEKNRPADYHGPDVLGCSSPSKLVVWLLPWRTLPGIFAAAWLVIAWINVQR